jgi:serine/threonine protein kinase
MHNPIFEIIDDFGSSKRISVAQAVTEQERAFNKTEFSNVLLAVETRTRRLCVIKASKRATDAHDTVDNQRALENEAHILRQLGTPGHRHLVQLLPVSAREYIAKDKDTGVYFLAEPYYAGYTLADLVNPLPLWEEIGLQAIRWLNYRLLTLTVFLGRRPSSRRLIPDFLPVDDRMLMPSNKIDSSGKPLPVADALEIAVNIVDLLVYLHARGVVHCDLKPSNVLYKKIQWPGCRNHDQLVIVDYGAAVKVGASATAGTPRWSPPEQHNCPAAYSMDLFAVGKMLIYLLSGEVPPSPGAEEPGDPLVAKAAGPVALAATPALTAKRLRFPWYLTHKERAACTQKINLLISNLLAQDSADRPGSATEVQACLKEIRSMTTKRLSAIYLLLGFIAAIFLLLAVSSGLRTDIAVLAGSMAPPIAAGAVGSAGDAGVSSEAVGSVTTIAVGNSTAVVIQQGFGVVANASGASFTPTPVPGVQATPSPTATAKPVSTNTAISFPTPTATSVALQPVRREAPRAANVSVAIIPDGEAGLQLCAQEETKAETFGLYEVKIRFKLEGNVVRPKFELQVGLPQSSEPGSEIPFSAVGPEAVGAAFRDLGGGVYQFNGRDICTTIGCNPDLGYRWRLRVTDEFGNSLGASDWCKFKFEKLK